jgi:hypothetical protein
MRINPDHHAPHDVLLAGNHRCRRAGQRYFELGKTPLEPLHATAAGGTHAMSESHEHTVDSRVGNAPTDHLDRAWPDTGRNASEQVAATSALIALTSEVVAECGMIGP